MVPSLCAREPCIRLDHRKEFIRKKTLPEEKKRRVILKRERMNFYLGLGFSGPVSFPGKNSCSPEFGEKKKNSGIEKARGVLKEPFLKSSCKTTWGMELTRAQVGKFYVERAKL